MLLLVCRSLDDGGESESRRTRPAQTKGTERGAPERVAATQPGSPLTEAVRLLAGAGNHPDPECRSAVEWVWCPRNFLGICFVRRGSPDQCGEHLPQA